jgi:O-antigen ligase
MLFWFSNLVPFFFYLLFFFVPLILFPKTSELFEFNKMVLTYGLTTLIASSWLTKMVLEKRINFRHTILDIPLIIFLGSQLLSTATSVDIRTSIFGYYSRFHGGLLSSVSYSLLYWAYVSNMGKIKTIKSIYILLASAVLVSIYGVLEHFGIDKDIWVQDVQNRVFATLGQPNWLAAWLVALIPLTWALAILNTKNKRFWLWVGVSTLFFLALLYTRSRSGILGFIVADAIFWAGIGVIVWKKEREFIIRALKTFVICHLSFVILAAASGSPWTPSVRELLTKKPPPVSPQPPIAAPALEVGGTESGQIRKIVWRGTIDIWRSYPILGSGVETFAFSYYNFRPLEHNLVSEWNFLYNKAHNEYLNFLATTGAVGLIAYLILPVVFFYWSFRIITKAKLKIVRQRRIRLWRRNRKLVLIGLVSGYASILVTNFFGFSVVPVALQFFLYPAFAVALATSNSLPAGLPAGRTGKAGRQVTACLPTRQGDKEISISNPQKLATVIVLLITFYLLLITGRYWYADYLLAKGRLENDSQNFAEAHEILIKAIKLSSRESIFWDELANATTAIAISFNESGDEKQAQELAKRAYTTSQMAVSLSPANVNLKRRHASQLIKLSAIEPRYLLDARDTLEDAIKLAPTDAQLFYNLALAYVRLGERERAIATLEETVKKKPNYGSARFALALLLIDEGETQRAKEELNYILKYISPGDVRAIKELEELESGQ